MTDFNMAVADDKSMPRDSVMTMTRRHFNSFLSNLYDCEKRGVSNDVEADVTINEVSHVEVLFSPEGPLVAVHHGFAADRVTVFRAEIDPADLGIKVAE